MRQLYKMQQCRVVIKRLQEKINNDNNTAGVPVKVCRICLTLDCKLFPMNMYQLEQAYESVTGILLDEDCLPQYVCYECSQRLLNSHRFRQKCIKTNLLLNEIAKNETEEYLTLQSIQSISRELNHLNSPLTHVIMDNIDSLSFHKPTTIHATNENSGDRVEVKNELVDNGLEENLEEKHDIKLLVVGDEAINGLDSLISEQILTIQTNGDTEYQDSGDDHDQDVTEEAISDTSLNKYAIEPTDNVLRLPVVPEDNLAPHNGDDGGGVSTSGEGEVQGKKYRHKRNLIEHELINTDDNSTRSMLSGKKAAYDVCRKKNSKKFNLRQRDKDHTGEKPHACDICGKKFHTPIGLNRHVRLHPIAEKLYVCGICGKNFVQKGDLRNHMTKHTVQDAHRCDVCGKVFTLKSNLRQHFKVHTGEKTHACDICGKRFVQKKYLNRHLIIHTGQKAHVCDICGQKFNTKTNLNRHLIIHTGQKEHVCDICGKYFLQKIYLINHLTKHTTQEMTKHICDVCGKNFSEKGSLRVHLLLHTGHKPHMCDICGKSYSHISDFKTHMMIHTGHKPHMCDICGKKFPVLRYLRKHALIHTSDKRHFCDICGKKFLRKCEVDTHIMIHTGLKPHVCDICGKKFTFLTNLRSHVKLHTGDKPHSCDLCGKKFSRKYHLVRHRHNHK